MLNLSLAALAFLGIHLGSSTPLRAGLVARLGEGTWTGLFSLLSIAAIWWLVAAYDGAPVAAPVFLPPPGARWIANTLMPLAFLLVTLGLLTPNPSTVGQGAVLEGADPARGINAVTRHPFFWGVVLWSLSHMLNNPAPADLVFFGTLGLLAFAGTFAVDAKKRRQLGQAWKAYEARTSNVPFAAIAGGRNTVSVATIGWWRIALALLLWLGSLALHPWAFGVSPLPG